MLKKGFILLILILFLSCNWFSEQQVSKFTGKDPISREKVIEKFQILSVNLSNICPNHMDAFNYMINKGYGNQFNSVYYETKQIEICLLFFSTNACSEYTDTASQIQHFKNIIYLCKLKEITIK